MLQRTVTYHYQGHLLTGIDNNLGQHEEQTTYDQYTPSGRVIAQTEQDGRRIAVDYQADHITLTTTGSDGTSTNVTTYQYDPFRNTLTGVLHNGVQVRQVRYDANFSPGSSTDGDGNGNTVVSNSMGLPTGVTDAMHGTRSVQYDAQSRPQLATDTMGRKTQLTYDAAGYPLAGDVLSWTYDQTGNLRTDGTTTNTCDDTRARVPSRLTGATIGAQSSSYSYNGDGTLVAQTSAGATTAYAQDLAGGQRGPSGWRAGDRHRQRPTSCEASTGWPRSFRQREYAVGDACAPCSIYVICTISIICGSPLFSLWPTGPGAGKGCTTQRAVLP